MIVYQYCVKVAALKWILEHKTIPYALHKVTFGSILVILAVSKDAIKQPTKQFLLLLTLFCNDACAKGNQESWQKKLWWIGHKPPNPPKFSPTNVLCYMVF